MFSDADYRWMRQALALAKQAWENGEVPVGAILVGAGEALATQWNQPIAQHDPTAHAEVMALREAGRRLGNYRFPDTTLYVTLEPCAMCAGALVHARVKRVVYAAADPKGGAAGTCFQLLQHPALNHRVDVEGGCLADESAALLQAFFQQRR